MTNITRFRLDKAQGVVIDEDGDWCRWEDAKAASEGMSRDLGFTPRDGVDEILAWVNPNRERISCPPPVNLRELAVRRMVIGGTLYEHLVRCSPCYRTFRALQEAARPPMP